MTIGQKIKRLRTEKELTQKDLADQLHVTFQTISKWENDENEPDLATVRELAKLFGCSLDYLISEEEEEFVPEPVVKEVPVIKETVIIHQNDIHVCAKCGKDIPEDELVSEDIRKRERHGRLTRTVTIGQTYYHKSCLDEVKLERAKAEAAAKAIKASKSKKRCFGWGIVGGVITLVIVLVSLLISKNPISPGLAVLFSILSGYGIFAMVYCILSGSYIGDVFTWCASLSIRFPGIIFSWDLEGVAFLIVMKILFVVLGIIIGILALIFAIVFSAILGSFSFPFVLIHNIRTNYADAF